MVTMCQSGSVLVKAGAGVDTTLSGSVVTSAGVYAIEEWIEQAESYINSVTRYNWTDAYATLNDDVKKLLEEAASDIAAMYAISYNISNYNVGAHAQTQLNVLRDRVQLIIQELKDKKVQDFMTGA